MSSNRRVMRPVKMERASARMRAILKDIQDTMGVPWPPALWRAYANYPEAMHLFWGRLRPAVATESFLQESLGISERAYREASNWYRPGFRPPVPEKERRQILWELDALEFGNPQLLIQQVALTRALRGETVGREGRAGRRQHASSYREPEIQLVGEREAPDEVKRIYRDIKRTMRLPLINSDYQALGKWPAFLKLAWEDTKQWLQRDEYQRLEQELSHMAEEAANRLQPPLRIDREELLKAVGSPEKLEELEQTMELFSCLLPGLTLNDALFRIAAVQRRRAPARAKAGVEQGEVKGETAETMPPKRGAAPRRLRAVPGRDGVERNELHQEYAYERFGVDALIHDATFGGGPRPGEPMPDFDLRTTRGRRIRKRDFVGQRPLLLTFASLTDPMAASAAPALKRLHALFGDRVVFVTLYVRESHPGERFPQPEGFEQKLGHARLYEERDAIPWTVAVDGVKGEVHRALGANSNAAYLMDTRGNVAFRSLWSNDDSVLREPLEAITSGDSLPLGQREPMVVPLLKGTGALYQVLDTAGDDAKDDVLRSLPPLYALALLASLFQPFSPLVRGIAALATSALGLATLVGGIRWLLTRRGRT